MLYTVENRDDLERLILNYLSEQKQNSEIEHYSISWDAVATPLKTTDRSVLAAWANDFAQRANLMCSPAINGVNFTPVKPHSI